MLFLSSNICVYELYTEKCAHTYVHTYTMLNKLFKGLGKEAVGIILLSIIQKI